MTAPRLPGIGFTDGAMVQTADGPRVFVEGRWQPVTASFRCFGIGLTGDVKVGIRVGDTVIGERRVQNYRPVPRP